MQFSRTVDPQEFTRKTQQIPKPAAHDPEPDPWRSMHSGKSYNTIIHLIQAIKDIISLLSIHSIIDEIFTLLIPHVKDVDFSDNFIDSGNSRLKLSLSYLCILDF